MPLLGQSFKISYCFNIITNSSFYVIPSLLWLSDFPTYDGSYFVSLDSSQVLPDMQTLWIFHHWILETVFFFSWMQLNYLEAMCICRGWGMGYFIFFRAISMAYWGSQARDQIRAIATGLYHSHSNARSKLCLRHTPQLASNTEFLTH